MESALDAHRLKQAAAILCLLAATTACQSFRFGSKEQRVHHFDEIGNLRVSVLSVARWEDYVNSLQPGFTLTPEQALSKVVPDTRLLDQRILDASRTDLAVGLPGIGMPGGAPGSTEGLSTAGSAAGSRTAAGIAPLGALEKSDLGGVDPMLQYGAATALYQEVQLLNRYVQDAALRSGYAPYVVRLQVGLMPRRRNMPYDAYVNLGFFPEAFREESTPSRDTKIPYVVPLLVTDSLEAGLHAVAINRLVETSLALQGTFKGVAAQGNQRNTREDLERALGRDLNSLFMVSRLSDNTVRVRLGAYQQINNDYAMVPRNHTITLLLLIPEGTPGAPGGSTTAATSRVFVEARTEMVDVASGKAVGGKADRQEVRDVRRIVKRCFPGDGWFYPSRKELETLRGPIDGAFFAAARNDWAGFHEKLGELPKSQMACSESQLWSELVNLTPGYWEDAFTFELPSSTATLFPPRQVVTLFDDAKAKTVATVVGGQGLLAGNLCPALHLVDESRSKFLIPTTTRSVGSGERVVFEFPSLAQLGFAEHAQGKAKKSAHLQVAHHGTRRDKTRCWKEATTSLSAGTLNAAATAVSLRTAYQTPPKPTAVFAMKARPGHVASEKGAGTLVLELTSARDAPGNAVIEVSRASVAAVKVGSTVVPASQTFQVKLGPKKGNKVRVEVALANLVPGRSLLVVAATDKKQKQGEQLVDVK